MMYKFVKSPAFIILVIIISLCYASCKKGCTDPTALNYNHSAKVQDGSCLYCDSAQTFLGTASNDIEDFNPNSSYYEQDVVNFTVTGNLVVYNGNGCPMLGHTSSTGCNTIIYSIFFQNVTGATVTLSAVIPIVEGNSSSQNFTTANLTVTNLIISPFSTATLNFSSASCVGANFFNTESVQNISLTYH